MRAGLLVFLVAVAAGGILDDSPRQRRDVIQRKVSIRDVTKPSDGMYPDELHLEVRTADGETETFLVKRNLHFNTNPPVETSENGVKKRYVFMEPVVAEYLSKRAALHVRSAEVNDQRYERTVTGGLIVSRDNKYLVERDASGEHVMTRIDTPPIVEDMRIEVGQELHDGLTPPNTRSGFARQKTYPVGYTLYPDILMVIDHGIYTKMGEKFAHLPTQEREEKTIQRIKEYYSLIGAGIAHKYEQVNYKGMTIKPRVGGILILKTPGDDRMALGLNKDGREIDGHKALQQQSHWFQGEKRRGHYQHIDHCMLFTSHRMYSIEEDGSTRNYGVVGLAYAGEVCNYWQTSMNEDDFSMRVISTAAHELGHNLGAGHDSTKACIDSYIMAPMVTDGQDDNFGNQYKFSTCSLESFYQVAEKMNRDRVNCMTDKPELDPVTQRLQNILPGQIYTLNQQCQIFTKRDDAYYCGAGSECRKLSCETGFGCFAHDKRHALYGTPCGQGRECRYGVCENI